MSDVCGKYMYEKFNEIVDDTRRMFTKVIMIFSFESKLMRLYLVQISWNCKS